MGQTIYMKVDTVNKNDALILRWWHDSKLCDGNEVPERLKYQNDKYQLCTKPVQ